ncbi:hypothetical protein A3B85_03405 [Candidatus Nomurabacteria bacterium RIFCSPHIGHO2_02_FULL_37_13]|uniref:Prepilin-type N-terminal cleavage/methylation domain-containing protein n=1 Tax=Candidatus Nomurabacteria bacterium RIFCSPHIGHO2_02_FULL_37_13 TaxID=1801750 RepID=A0A1F6W7A8_9BACT|nr:MAG: hypothetical protein A2640_01100 [Candidatus Nomurabacteria bacterium RIFCSPHIGHO2_01_FULL_36_23]OGI77781.1 MAG: hypothetical protein A3B85_03405 [Candidatus Nomurabacteria bacterium RIFCSPHIGHO2_02_FULL_37_13]OGI87668.1 MAG: hypothetical protein A2906_00205 [Candidatus Nomurabacteria bacterium RIFCSPLOWO2_01_FULL_37_25]
MKIFLKQKNKGRQILSLSKGFTLVETLVAISIFTTSILALLVILSGSISNTGYAKKKIIASYLAQEGIEYIRNMRDTFVLYGATSQAGWNAFNTKVAGPSGNTVCASADGCYFGDLNAGDFTNPSQPMAGIAVTACVGACPELKYDITTGKYNYTTGASSGYIRKIIVSPISVYETKISSTVYWTQGSGNYNMVFSENLFNWVE